MTKWENEKNFLGVPLPKFPELAEGWAGSGYILGAIGCACACRSPPRTKPRVAGLVPNLSAACLTAVRTGRGVTIPNADAAS